ncbi:MAG: IPT/TIG domain-containing protein, partial [Desulfobacteraceae bacterium]|nr:IPT/TIG domain-containing protein [Desulfobacteraceae bacterium]
MTGSPGVNTLNVTSGARVECRNFVGANRLNLEELTEQFTIYRSGATAYLESTAGTLIKIPATRTDQTLHFSDGSHKLAISQERMILGSQIISSGPAPIPPPVSVYSEVEFNGNMEDANTLPGSYPFLISGSLAPDSNYSVDDDYFEFTAVSGDLITLSLLKTGNDFNPSLSLVDSTGLPMAVISHSYASGEAISVRIPEDGAYYAVVSEKHNQSADGFTYKLEIFLDSDMDGLSDAFERSIGLDPENPDSDGDGLPDGIEYSYAADNPDPDMDGLNAWWDTDSDGDGIPDFIEGVGDVDGDGVPNFLDLDSDGNGTPDAVEAGSNPLEPLDTDGDGIYDFLDTDDDGDGLLDINDPQRTTHASQSDLLITDNRVYLLSFETIITGSDGNTYNIREIARTGDEIKISGEGFEQDRTLVILDTTDGPDNIIPTNLTSNEVIINLPENALSGPLRVAVNGILSNPLSLEIVSSSHPIIYSVSHSVNDTFVMPGETITITGENLNADSSNILFSGTTTSALSHSATETRVSITVPDDAQTGDIRVSALGISNPVALLIRTEVYGHVELPTGSSLSLSDLEIEFSNSIRPISSDGTFTLPVFNQATSSITIFMPSVPGQHDPAVFLSATVLAEDTSVTVSPASTAADLVFSAMGLESLIHPDDLKTALELVESATSGLATYLNDALGANPYFMENYTRTD